MDQYGLGSTFYSNSTDTEPWTTVQYCGSKLPVVWYSEWHYGTMQCSIFVGYCSTASTAGRVRMLH